MTVSSPQTPAEGSDDANGNPDRRSAPRYACSGSAEVEVLGGVLRFRGEIVDLSARGCRIETKSAFRLERGTEVEVMLRVRQIGLRVLGVVRANRSDSILSIAFHQISERRARQIEELTRELAGVAGTQQRQDAG